MWTDTNGARLLDSCKWWFPSLMPKTITVRAEANGMQLAGWCYLIANGLWMGLLGVLLADQWEQRFGRTFQLLPPMDRRAFHLALMWVFSYDRFWVSLLLSVNAKALFCRHGDTHGYV